MICRSAGIEKDRKNVFFKKKNQVFATKNDGQVPLVLCGLKKPNIINQLLNILCKKK